MAELPPNIITLLRYFEYSHLPTHLQAASVPFKKTAWALADALPPSAELTAGLRKLLEAKDCMVRAALDASREDKAEDADGAA